MPLRKASGALTSSGVILDSLISEANLSGYPPHRPKWANKRNPFLSLFYVCCIISLRSSPLRPYNLARISIITAQPHPLAPHGTNFASSCPLGPGAAPRIFDIAILYCSWTFPARSKRYEGQMGEEDETQDVRTEFAGRAARLCM